VRQAANRELAEESGLKVRRCKEIGFFFTYNRRSDQKQFVVLCTDLYEEKANGDPEEFIESHWLPHIKIEKMAASGELHNMNLMAALHLYFVRSKSIH
jgi:8-oxo-dGTP pyrophosphatase MutT (NUDIX family)